MVDSEVVECARAALLETGSYGRFARAVKAHFGWTCTVRQAEARVAHWLSPECPHHLPAAVLPLLVEITGRDPFTSLLVEARARSRKPALRKEPHEQDPRRARWTG